MLVRLSLSLAVGILAAPAAFASEVQTYSYDAPGRLVSVTHAGSVNNGVQAHYAHDGADNRSNFTVTGTGRAAPANSGAARASSITQRPTTGSSMTKVSRSQ